MTSPPRAWTQTLGWSISGRIRHEDERIALLQPVHDFSSLTEHRAINRGEKLPSSRENRRHAASMVATGVAYGPSDPRLKATGPPCTFP